MWTEFHMFDIINSFSYEGNIERQFLLLCKYKVSCQQLVERTKKGLKQKNYPSKIKYSCNKLKISLLALIHKSFWDSMVPSISTKTLFKLCAPPHLCLGLIDLALFLLYINNLLKELANWELKSYFTHYFCKSLE